MTISFKCPCGKQWNAKDEHAGKRTKCPSCGASLVIPSLDALIENSPRRPSPPPLPAEAMAGAVTQTQNQPPKAPQFTGRFFWQVYLLADGMLLLDDSFTSSEITEEFAGNTDGASRMKEFIAQMQSCNQANPKFMVPAATFTMEASYLGTGTRLAQVRSGSQQTVSIFMTGEDPESDLKAIERLSQLSREFIGRNISCPDITNQQQRPLAVTFACCYPGVSPDAEKMKFLIYGAKMLGAAFFKSCYVI